MNTIDETDRKIINVLVENSRLSLRKIAKKVGVSVATVMNRMKELEKDKIINSYTVGLDYTKLGYDICAIIDVRVAHRQTPDVDRKIKNHPSVVTAFNMTGDFDITILARFKTRQELDEFIKWLQSFDVIYRSQTKLILNTVKEEVMKV